MNVKGKKSGMKRWNQPHRVRARREQALFNLEERITNIRILANTEPDCEFRQQKLLDSEHELEVLRKRVR